MNFFIHFSIVLVIFTSFSRSQLIDYSSYSLFVVTPDTKFQLNILQNISNSKEYKVDFWSYPYKVNNTVKILVSKVEIRNFTAFLDNITMTYTIENVDLNGYTPTITGSNRNVFNPEFNLNTFNTYADAMQWLSNKVNSCSTCELIKIGTTIQNRSIYLFKIGTPDKRGIFIDANIHAREWITGASALHLINILTNVTDPLGRYLSSKLTFHIVPFANPDGYEYSRTSNRLWRKNRKSNSGLSCVGVDPNRNYQNAFGGVGSSGSACDDTFRGRNAFSEQEPRALSSYIATIKNELIAYIALHSYGRLILLPWGCNYSKPADYDELLRVGNAMNVQIQAFTGSVYEVIPGSDLYPAGGASDDWAKSQGIKYVYTFEMGPDRFDPPSSQILTLSKEFIGAIRGLVRSLPRS